MFGWRRASKCKNLIRRALGRLKMLKKKRYSIVRQLREDLSELIDNGYQHIAFTRVEQLIRDERLLEAYELIEDFCEFILVNLSYIRKNKNYPDDMLITEAISSLVFASARCGDFPELKLVREFFGKLYGQSFVMAAIDSWPENPVNLQIEEKLSMKPVSVHEKQRLINEIAGDCFHQAILALEYCPDWHHKQDLDIGINLCERREEPKLQNSSTQVLERELICVDSSFVSSELEEKIVPKELVEVYNDSEFASSSFSTVNSTWKAEECGRIGWIEAASLEETSSSERWPLFSNDDVVYLDDVVELHNSTMEDGELLDHRLFKFKSPPVIRGENVEEGYNRSFVNDAEILSKSGNGSGNRKQQNKVLAEENQSSSLNCWLYSDEDDYEVVISEQKIVHSHFIRSAAHYYLESDLSVKDYGHHENLILWTGDSVKETTEEKRRSCEIETMVYDVFVYFHYQPEEEKESDDGKPEEFSTMAKHELSLGSYEMENISSDSMKIAELSLEQCRDSEKDELLVSCLDKYPSHVHPKLPDYDEIAAKFMSLKREHLQNKHKFLPQKRS